MYCYLCAASITKNEKFCRNCGAESVFLSEREKGTGVLASVGYFVGGVLSFILISLALFLILSTLFPSAGPQGSILVLGVMSLLLAGTTAVLYSKVRTKRLPNPLVDDEAKVKEISAGSNFILPEGRIPVYPPASVTELTTDELKVRR